MAADPNTFPVPKFHFKVSIDGTEISFQEASGLEQETQFLEYRKGDNPIFITQKRLGMSKTSTLSFKKGTFSKDSDTLAILDPLLDLNGGGNDKYFANSQGIPIVVELLDETAATMCTWNIEKAYPIKYTGTDLKSDANDVAIEAIEFVHEGMKITF